MNRAICRLQTFMHSLEGHFVIRNNALFVYDQQDKLKYCIPTFILNAPTHTPELLRQSIRKILD